jgi:RNA polymerase sigma factor (sigma-70 family)
MDRSFSRRPNLRFTLDDEENATIVDAMERTRLALDVIPEQEMFARMPFYAKKSDELAVAMRAGEPGAFDRFCEFHLRLAKSSSRMLFHWFGMDEEDAFQIACIGIVHAARRFDPTRGYQFSTIASYWIRSCCQRYGLSAAYLVRFPVHVFWPLYKMQFTERQLLASFGLPAARERLYRSCKNNFVSPRDWLTFEWVKDLKTFSELDRNDWDSLLSIKAPHKSPVEKLMLKELRQSVLKGVARLNQREQIILHHRYGIGCKEHTLEEVATIYGVTRERIRQIQARAEEKLQIYLSHLDPNHDSLIDEDSRRERLEDLEEREISGEINAVFEPKFTLQIERVESPSDCDQNIVLSNEFHLAQSSMTTWIFSPVSASSVRRDPNETELFKTEQAGEGEYAGTDALVREVIQNSLDAGHREEPVRVRFALHSNNDMPAKNRLSHYFSRLEPALEFREIGFSEGVPQLPNGFLVCEDFGTSGLAGDPNLVTDPLKGSKERQDFFWFWRNIGRSGKTGDDLVIEQPVELAACLALRFARQMVANC